MPAALEPWHKAVALAPTDQSFLLLFFKKEVLPFLPSHSLPKKGEAWS
jgi:hypothetical protein